MAIKFRHFKYKETFDSYLKEGSILDTDLCWIKDSQQIYTHGQLYDCFGLSEEEITELINRVALNADWEALEGDKGFIKNKPFGDKLEQVLKVTIPNVLENQGDNIRITFDSLLEKTPYYYIDTDKFIVKINNEIFECTGRSSAIGFKLGTALDNTLTEEDHPFFISLSIGGAAKSYITLKPDWITSETFDLEIYQIVGVNTILRKYIPDIYQKKPYVINAEYTSEDALDYGQVTILNDIEELRDLYYYINRTLTTGDFLNNGEESNNGIVNDLNIVLNLKRLGTNGYDISVPLSAIGTVTKYVLVFNTCNPISRVGETRPTGWNGAFHITLLNGGKALIFFNPDTSLKSSDFGTTVPKVYHITASYDEDTGKYTVLNSTEELTALFNALRNPKYVAEQVLVNSCTLIAFDILGYSTKYSKCGTMYPVKIWGSGTSLFIILFKDFPSLDTPNSALAPHGEDGYYLIRLLSKSATIEYLTDIPNGNSGLILTLNESGQREWVNTSEIKGYVPVFKVDSELLIAAMFYQLNTSFKAGLILKLDMKNYSGTSTSAYIVSQDSSKAVSTTVRFDNFTFPLTDCEIKINQDVENARLYISTKDATIEGLVLKSLDKVFYTKEEVDTLVANKLQDFEMRLQVLEQR